MHLLLGAIYSRCDLRPYNHVCQERAVARQSPPKAQTMKVVERSGKRTDPTREGDPHWREAAADRRPTEGASLAAPSESLR
jgi:hypothetical protein